MTAEPTTSFPCQVLNGSATVNDVPSFTRNFSVVRPRTCRCWHAALAVM